MSEDTDKEADKKAEDEVTEKAAEAAKETSPAAAAPEEAPKETAPAAAAPKETAAAAPKETATTSPEAVVGTVEAAPAEAEKSEPLKKAEAILSQRGGGGGGGRSFRDDDDDLFEKVVFINRCSKVVKGGRRFSFSALVVTGDRDGKVGFGFGKAQEVAECIKKASESSKKGMVEVKIGSNTIPHPVEGRHGGGRVLLLPASPGTGLIAGGGVRAVVEAAGIKDVLAKSMGSNNHANVVKATLDALNQLRNKEEIYAARGKRVPEKRAL